MGGAGGDQQRAAVPGLRRGPVHHRRGTAGRRRHSHQVGPGRIAMSSGWFETVAAAQRRARKQLPKSVYWSIVAGSEQGATLKDNVAAFGELGFTPHAGGLPAKRDLATTVLGQPVSMPVICSPTGVQAVHPDGEVAVARAAASRGTAVGLSSFGSKPVEEAAAANPRTFFQVDWIGGPGQMEARVG